MNEWMNQWINQKGDCRTALDTLGLLERKTLIIQNYRSIEL